MNAEEEPGASYFPTHSCRNDDKIIYSEDGTMGYSNRSSEYNDTDQSILILESTTSASISSTTDGRISRKMDPVSTPKPTICDIDSQIPESTENLSMLLSPEALFSQVVSVNTRGKNNSVSPSERSGCPAEESSRPSEGLGHPLEGSGCPAEGSSCPSEGLGYPAEESGRPLEGRECSERFLNIVIVDDLQLSRIFFKAGALVYLLFLIRVLQKIYVMFRSQPLAVAIGNLIFSILLFILIQYHPPKQVKLEKKSMIPQIAVDAIIFIGAFTCVSFVLQMILIIAELVAY
ncbi:hypothetical protein C8R41DRAFT_919926 [Lentinula lateritia]|uniref:Uncharacterized protein n=1 Tax=Lentinula lateritia TaxID=40482 RepID=A0ABQ8VFX8_9AGAR|nr:hypothetical protein C8R41DRAFT_919926 [Lentinula lateritia]